MVCLHDLTEVEVQNLAEGGHFDKGLSMFQHHRC